MGVGIAYVFAAAGCETTVVEPDAARGEALGVVVREQARRGLERGKLTDAQAEQIPGLVRLVTAPATLPQGLDLVVESVPERLALKHEVLAAVEERQPVVVATNTSALSVDALAARLRRPEAFLGMHFFNPVWSLQLVELIRGSRTAPATVDAAQALVGLLGKQSIVVRDVPGFATSRLDLIAALEAMRMLEDGVASAEDIDKASVVAYRHPMGPLRLSDVVGLDVRLDIARALTQAHGERYAPPQILVDMVAAGHLGQKSGQGFFTWH
jgi:3-hydroxybutyryl-CoA dehydrogenase